MREGETDRQIGRQINNIININITKLEINKIDIERRERERGEGRE